MRSAPAHELQETLYNQKKWRHDRINEWYKINNQVIHKLRVGYINLYNSKVE